MFKTRSVFIAMHFVAALAGALLWSYVLSMFLPDVAAKIVTCMLFFNHAVHAARQFSHFEEAGAFTDHDVHVARRLHTQLLIIWLVVKTTFFPQPATQAQQLPALPHLK